MGSAPAPLVLFIQRYTAQWNLPSPRQEALALFCRELLRWATAMDLTGFLSEEEVVTKGIAPSLAYLHGFDAQAGLTLLDIGSGAGFPGLILKIARPSLTVTLLESSRKKISFLKHMTRILNLTTMQVLRGRAEDVAQDLKYRHAYDIVTARALATPPEALPLCLPFLKPGGRLILLTAGKGVPPLPPEGVSLQERPILEIPACLLVYTREP